MSIKEVEEWAWDIKHIIPEQKYIDLMDILKKNYDLKDYTIPHKIKIVITTKIKIASNDWIDNHDESDDYDDIEAENDSPEEEIAIETDMIFNVKLKNKVKYYSNWAAGCDKGYNLLYKSAYIEDIRNILSNKELLCRHLEAVALYKNSSTSLLHVEDTNKIVSYILLP